METESFIKGIILLFKAYADEYKREEAYEDLINLMADCEIPIKSQYLDFVDEFDKVLGESGYTVEDA